MNVTVVTVTYGNRAGLLVQVLDAARAQGAREAVVVDNGSAADVEALVGERFGDWAVVVDMGCNTGSAPGFRAGIELALARGAEYLLLLDDDNVVQPNCVRALFDVFSRNSSVVDVSRLGVSAWRVGRQHTLVPGKSVWVPTRSSFMGFRIQKLPAKIASLVLKPPPYRDLEGEEIAAPVGVYGGFFFHRNLIEMIGLPRTDFVLYSDDLEFTHRINKIGGRIILASDARVSDIALSWHEEHPGVAGPIRWVAARPSSAIFYQFRNAVFYAFHVQEKNWLALLLNMSIYLSVVLLAGIAMRRWRALCVILRALRDGLVGRLGPSPAFPL